MLLRSSFSFAALALICACGGDGGAGSPAQSPGAETGGDSPGSTSAGGSADNDDDGIAVPEDEVDCNELRKLKLEECTQIAQCDPSDPDCDPSLIPEMKETCRALADVELLVCKCKQGDDKACDDLESDL